MNTTKVMFKGDKLGIKIIIDKDLSFEDAKKYLQIKASESKKIFGNSDTGITFIGKELTDEEMMILLDILCKECELNVNFALDETYVSKFLKAPVKQEPVKEEKINENYKQEINETINQIFNQKENITIFHRGSLRSGASIKHNGSVVIIGDVNAGAEIIAAANVIVLGSAKGLIQAGCTGDKSCFVFALNLLPTQLRIGNVIAFIPTVEKIKKGTYKPQIAHVEDEKMIVSEV